MQDKKIIYNKQKFIYAYENMINGKMYVGQTVNIIARDNQHSNYGDNTMPIDLAIKKYGRNNFSLFIIKIVDTYIEANQEEIYWINILRESIGKINVYNISNGGDGAMIGRKHSQKSKNKMSIKKIGTNIGTNNPNSKFSELDQFNICNDYYNNIKLNIILSKYLVSNTSLYRILKTHSTPLRPSEPMSERQKLILSKIHKGKTPWNKGKKILTPPWNKGKKELQTAWNKGNGKPKIKKPLREKKSKPIKLSKEEISKKLSLASKGKYKKEIHKQHISEGRLSSNKVRGSNLPWSKLDEAKVLSLRDDFITLKCKSKREAFRILGKKYNVSAETIRAVIIRRSWKHI